MLSLPQFFLVGGASSHFIRCIKYIFNYNRIMEYKVVPFTATLNKKNERTSVVAEQLETLIKQFNNQGWEYVRLENVATYVQPAAGFLGIGAKAMYLTSYQVVVFCKN